MTKDLGTYYVRVVFEDGSGFIMAWETGARYSLGRECWHPLTAKRSEPLWESEDNLLRSIEFMFTAGNYSCDCNLKDFIDNAHQIKVSGNECGNTMKIKTLTAIRPDGSECELSVVQ